MTYAQATVDYVDFCNRDTWSILWLQDILQQLGYAMEGRCHVYWSPPWKEIHERLFCIERDSDIVHMINTVETHKQLVLLIVIQITC